LHRFTSFPLQFPLSFLFFFLFKFFFLHCYHTPQSRSPFRGTADKSNKRIGDLCCSKLIHLVGDIEVFASNNMRIFNCLVDFATDRKPSFLNKCVIFGPLFILYNPCAWGLYIYTRILSTVSNKRAAGPHAHGLLISINNGTNITHFFGSINQYYV
jgi:hypothetical protein